MADWWRFERFEIHAARRELRVGGFPVTVGARAFDLLVLLIEQRGKVLLKGEILSTIWSGQFVEENNLAVQISSLRRLLGADVIATVSGRGYRFVAEPLPASRSMGTRAPGNLLPHVPEIYGRERELGELLHTHARLPCVTLCGLAGVGKTTLAIRAGHELARTRPYAHGVWQVELASLEDPQRLVQAVCETIGLEINPREAPLTQCLSQIRHRELLLLLDNCEHLADEVAGFVDAVVRTAGSVHVLATSQEPLRVAGERILRLNPLEVPATCDAPGARDYGAVRMLTERIREALGGSFEPGAQEIVDIVEVCRQLDGVPLALEFAAARVPVLGLAGVRSRLHERLRLLSRGPRSAPSRHGSLQAALEWSHQLLPGTAQSLLHQLAIFPGGFSLEGAERLIGPSDASELVEHLGVLVERSLILRLPGEAPRYRMLETTRAFALQCLHAQANLVDWNSRFAHAMADLCAHAAGARDSVLMWQEAANARSALAWALKSPGHEQVAITIATFIAVSLGAAGATGEALDHLKSVRPLVDEHCPTMLAARFWHWYGRVGSEGRMPVSQSVEAMTTADALFASLGERRHRHACHRHLAEVLLEAGDPDGAETHLEVARDLEREGVLEADRMRRLRVESRLADARGAHGLALRHAQAALESAEALGVKRYRLLLRADMAWTRLQMGRAEEAVEGCLELLRYLDDSIRQGQARGHVLSGLTAALVAAGQIERAVKSAADSLASLRAADLLRARSEVFAWVASAAGFAREAAQLLGVGESFAERSENQRDRVTKMARREALATIESNLGPPESMYWQQVGRQLSDVELGHLLERVFAASSTASGTPNAELNVGSDDASQI